MPGKEQTQTGSAPRLDAGQQGQGGAVGSKDVVERGFVLAFAFAESFDDQRAWQPERATGICPGSGRVDDQTPCRRSHPTGGVADKRPLRPVVYWSGRTPACRSPAMVSAIPL